MSPSDADCGSIVRNYAIHNDEHRLEHEPMSRTVPCVLMRAGTSRGPFFLREWLPTDEVARDEALIGAIGASDLLQLDGVGGAAP